MSKTIFDITSDHGKEMYMLGLEHAINTIEVRGEEDGLEHLKDKLKQRKKELEDEQGKRTTTR